MAGVMDNSKKCDCGKVVVFVLPENEKPGDKPIPLDPASAVYQVLDPTGNPRARRANGKDVAPGNQYWVNHFATCSKANKFTKVKPRTRGELIQEMAGEPVPGQLVLIAAIKHATLGIVSTVSFVTWDEDPEGLIVCEPLILKQIHDAITRAVKGE